MFVQHSRIDQRSNGLDREEGDAASTLYDPVFHFDGEPRRMDDLAPGGGFILTPRWALRPEVPPQNICAIYEVVAEYA